jgi:hypothetical protein
MKKHLLILILLFTSNILYAVEIKLSCDIEVEVTYWTGNTEKKQVTNIVTIADQGARGKFIISSGSHIRSVTTKESENRSVTDLSDSNSWEITNEVTSQNDVVTTFLKIDRNTGKFFYDSFQKSKDGKDIRFEGRGNCEKVDTAKKKF